MLNPINKHDDIDRLQMTIERAQRGMIYSSTETARRFYPHGQVTAVFLQCGGAAISVPDSLDFRLNLAFSTPKGLSEHDIQALETSFISCDRPLAMFIPTSSPRATFEKLETWGFSKRGGTNNVLIRSLEDIETSELVQNKTSTIVDDITIAPATPNELDAFVEYHSRSDDGFPSEKLKLTAQITIQIPDTTIILAKLDGRIIASTAVTALETGPGEVAAYTGLTSTLTECRGKGVSTALKRFVHIWAKKRGYRWIFAHVESENSNMRVLEKLGYRSLFPHAVYFRDSGSVPRKE